MKKLLVFALAVSFAVPAWAGSPGLFKQYSGKTVKIHVDVQDASETKEVGDAMLRSKFEEALKGRKSINFKLVDSPAEADLLLKVKMLGFTWTDHDPVDMLMGVGGTAADAAIIEDYAAIEAETTVTDAKNSRVLWSDKLFATVTKKPMPRVDSVPLVTAELAKVFLRDCFSKKGDKAHR